MNKKGHLTNIATGLGVSPEEIVLQAVRETGSKKAAAKKLAISRSTVSFHMKKLKANVKRTTQAVVEFDSGKDER